MELEGENVRVEQEPENGLELRITILDADGEPRSVASAFAPGDDPPPAFPAAVPFVPRASINVIDDRERGVLLALWRLDDADDEALAAALDRVVAASVDDGWTLAERTASRSATLTREDRRRRVEAGRSGGGRAVSMAERAG